MRERNDNLYIFGKNAILEFLNENLDKVLEIYFLQNTFQKSPDLKKIYQNIKNKKISSTFVDKKFFTQKVGDVNHQGLIARIKKIECTDLKSFLQKLDTKKNNLVVLLEHTQDTHNFGAVIRTATAVGACGIIIENHTQAPVNGTVFKTSAGTIGKIDIIKVSNLPETIEKIKKHNFWVYALEMVKEKKEKNIWQQDFKNSNTAFVLGSEGKGLSVLAKKKCDVLCSIPMEKNVESLNLSVAAAIILYEWKRQQSIKNI